MSVAKNAKTPLQHSGFEYLGTVARIRRSGGTSRAGRRSALLGLLTAAYANASRSGGRTPEPRTSGGDRS